MFSSIPHTIIEVLMLLKGMPWVLPGDGKSEGWCLEETHSISGEQRTYIPKKIEKGTPKNTGKSDR